MFTPTHFNKKYFNFFASVVIISGALLVSFAFIAFAVSKDDISYPVAELNGCENEAECRSFCDDPANIEACVSFAERHNLISKGELEHAKKFIAIGASGPGGCDSAGSCESYCNDITNIDECLAFAEQTGLIPPDELEEARKVQAALKAGAQLPGGCRNKDECEAYCESPDHMEECIAFGEAAGFIPPGELEEARKVLTAIKAGATPPPCRGRNECDTYCRAPENMEACLTFAEAAGLIPENELQDAKKMLQAIKKGIKPPACGGREECDAYCSEDAHFEECLNFAEAAGFIAPEEVEMARKTGGKGPGDCKGREECEAFCQNPANQETCFSFALEHDLLSEEDKQRIEEGRQETLRSFENAPPEVRSCLEGAIDIEGIRSGAVMPSESMGRAIQNCFEQFMPRPEDFTREGEFGPPQGFEGQLPPEEFQRQFEEEVPPEFQEQFQQEFQRQSEEQFQQQFQQQFEEQFRQQQLEQQHQFEQQSQQFQQPEGTFPAPGEFQPPPEGFQPPPEFHPEPTSITNPVYLLASPFLRVFGL